MIFQKAKTYIVTLGVFSLILGSIFALCYLPFMQMSATHPAAAQTTHMAAGSNQCCESQSAHHILTAASIPASPINLESLLLLLGLSILSLFGTDALLSIKNFINAKLLHGRQFLLRLFDYLIQLFSRGVLHPKLYNA
ncbi:MAG: hypothetical protein M1333_00140 [Patescibacteria group bacterium]|nr:hypothetical protein [Patescibacteria group bacterium]